MPTTTMTIRLSREESARVATLAQKRKMTRSDLVRAALRLLEESQERSALDDLSDLVGVVKGAPRDLATNPKHMKGFGKK